MAKNKQPMGNTIHPSVVKEHVVAEHVPEKSAERVEVASLPEPVSDAGNSLAHTLQKMMAAHDASTQPQMEIRIPSDKAQQIKELVSTESNIHFEQDATGSYYTVSGDYGTIQAFLGGIMQHMKSNVADIPNFSMEARIISDATAKVAEPFRITMIRQHNEETGESTVVMLTGTRTGSSAYKYQKAIDPYQQDLSNLHDVTDVYYKNLNPLMHSDAAVARSTPTTSIVPDITTPNHSTPDLIVTIPTSEGGNTGGGGNSGGNTGGGGNSGGGTGGGIIITPSTSGGGSSVAVNEAPMVMLASLATRSGVVNAGVAINGVSVTDDHSTITSMTFTIDHGIISLNTGVTQGITAGMLAGNGTSSITITGATLDQINNTLADAAGLSYTPPAGVGGGARLTITASDGSLTHTNYVHLTTVANTWNVSNLDAINGFRATTGTGFTRIGYGVDAAGDFNGDGFADYAVAGNSFASVGFGGTSSSLNSNLNTMASGGTALMLSSFPSATRIYGGGDINGDGLADIIATGATSTNGQANIVLGRSTGGSLNVSTGLNGSNGFSLTGFDTGDNWGTSASVNGDINNDGYDDILVSAWQDDGTGNAFTDSGAVAVLYGSGSGFNSSYNVNALSSGEGFLIHSNTNSYYLGKTVSFGDFNGDGLDDILATTHHTANPDYVLFGKRTGFVADYNITTMAASDGLVLNAPAGQTSKGEFVGDFNGDGYDDVLIGGYGNGVNWKGNSYLLYGGTTTGSVNLSAVNGTNGTHFAGNVDWAFDGYQARAAGDVNGDGFADIIITSHNTVSIYLIFGTNTGLGATFNLDTTNVNGTNGIVIQGPGAGGAFGYNASGIGDINGDGFDDVMVGRQPNAGNDYAYIVYGRDFNGVVTHNGDVGNDNIVGSAGVDYIVGGLGDDTLDGSTGIDVLIGANGNDVFIYDQNDREIRGGLGNDTIQVRNGNSVNLTTKPFNFISNVEVLDLSTDTAANTVTLSIDNVIRMSKDYNRLAITGGSNDVVNLDMKGLYGQLYTSGGMQYLATNLGTTLSFSSGITINLTNVSGTYLTNISDNLSGTGGADIFYGLGSNFAATDTITGGAGNDTLMILGGGLNLNSATATSISSIENIILRGNLANSITLTDGYFTAGAGVTSTTLSINASTSNAALTLDGSALSSTNILTVQGSIAADALTGGAGNDTLLGNAGNDTLNGGSGNDSLVGGDDSDVLNGGAGNDILNGGVGSDILTGGNGDDTLTGGTGSNQFVIGNHANTTDTITDFSIGTNNVIDLTAFGAVNLMNLDIQQVGSNTEISLNGIGATNQKIVLSSYNVSSLTEANFMGVTSTATSGDDTLTGNASANLINGGNGNDVINGGTGNDIINGGNGNDTITIDWNTATLPSIADSSLQLWLDANDLTNITKDGSNRVSAWNDRSTSPNNVTAAGALRPTWVDGGFNGRATLSFDGTNYLEGAFPDMPDRATILLVGTINAGDTTQGFYEISNGVAVNTGISFLYGSSFINRIKSTALNDHTYSQSLPYSAVYGLYYDGTSVQSYLDGSALGTATSTGALLNVLNTITIGSLKNLASYSLLGNISEMLVFDSALTTNDMALYNRYLMDKYGTGSGAGEDVVSGGAGEDTLNLSSGKFMMALTSTSAIKGIENFNFVGNNNAHDIVLNNSYYTADGGITNNRVSFDFTGNSTGVSVSAAALTGSNAISVTGSNAADTITGGGGADTINGKGGEDLLKGGAGADVFVFTALADSKDDDAGSAAAFLAQTAVQRVADVITDFTTGTDKIDLTGLGFTGIAAAGGGGGTVLEYLTDGTNTVIYKTDMSFAIELTGNITPVSGDFIF